MDEKLLASADAAYEAGDWAAAARDYRAAVEGDGEGAGHALHRAANALMRLRRLEEACTLYERALEDASYAERGAVAYNLGAARLALKDFAGAIAAFERALADPSYSSRYKAYQGLGGALRELGRTEDAAESYRKAALDGGNPDPGKALNNLGLCFMELGRPQDAVQAYRAAVDLEGYAGRGKAAANLGMAYAALDMHERAIAAFERSKREFGFEFPPAMEAAYRASMAAARLPEKVEGWVTGEMPPVPAPAPVPVPEAPDSQFFTITEDEMRASDREARRAERRASRAAQPAGSTRLRTAVLALALVGVLVAAYLMGAGYPTQEMTVYGMMEAYGAGEPVDNYWVAVPPADVTRSMATLPPQWSTYKVDVVDRSAKKSVVRVTVTLVEGGVVTYDVSLAREGVGWKVDGVTNSFSSMNGGV